MHVELNQDGYRIRNANGNIVPRGALIDESIGRLSCYLTAQTARERGELDEPPGEWVYAAFVRVELLRNAGRDVRIIWIGPFRFENLIILEPGQKPIRPGGGLSFADVWAVRRGDRQAPTPFLQDAIDAGLLYGDV